MKWPPGFNCRVKIISSFKWKPVKWKQCIGLRVVDTQEREYPPWIIEVDGGTELLITKHHHTLDWIFLYVPRNSLYHKHAIVHQRQSCQLTQLTTFNPFYNLKKKKKEQSCGKSPGLEFVLLVANYLTVARTRWSKCWEETGGLIGRSRDREMEGCCHRERRIVTDGGSSCLYHVPQVKDHWLKQAYAVTNTAWFCLKSSIVQPQSDCHRSDVEMIQSDVVVAVLWRWCHLLCWKRRGIALFFSSISRA